MPRPKSLRSNDDVKRLVTLCKDLGLPIGAIDIRTDGVTIHPPAPTQPAQGTAFDNWKSQQQPPTQRQDANRDRPARRQ